MIIHFGILITFKWLEVKYPFNVQFYGLNVTQMVL